MPLPKGEEWPRSCWERFQVFVLLFPFILGTQYGVVSSILKYAYDRVRNKCRWQDSVCKERQRETEWERERSAWEVRAYTLGAPLRVKVLGTQLCPTLCNCMDCRLPGSSVHGILLEWVAIPFSRGIFPTQGLNQGLWHCRQILYHLSHRRSLQEPHQSSPNPHAGTYVRCGFEHFNSGCLSFSICKMEVINNTYTIGLLWVQ